MFCEFLLVGYDLGAIISNEVDWTKLQGKQILAIRWIKLKHFHDDYYQAPSTE